MVLFSSLIRQIETDFHRSDAAFGLFYLARALVFAVGAFSGGFLTERFGRRRVLVAGTAIVALASFFSGLIHDWTLFLCVAAAGNLGAAIIDSGINALALDLFRDARAAALNLLHLFFGAGGLIAPFVVGALASSGVPWRTFPILTGLLFLVLVPPLLLSPMPHGRAERTETGVKARLWSGPFLWLALAIALYAGAEVGVSNWLVRLLAAQPLLAATATLSLFWGGLTVGRLLSAWVAERLDYVGFAAGCTLFASAALFAAVLTPWPLSVPLYTLAGLLYGPVYPMIMAVGGRLYPGRLAALSGTLTTAAEAGIIVYPPLMGVMAGSVGLGVGMMGAAALGLPTVLAILMTRSGTSRLESSARSAVAE
jgi:fucose permease